MAKRKKHSPYSGHWKKKALKVWSEIIRKDGCVICGQKDNTDAHHLIRRVRTKYVLDLDNGICLCKSHHNFNINLSAHGGNQATRAFFDWLEVNLIEQWWWFESHYVDHTTGIRVNYQERYEELTAILEKEID